MSDVGSFLLATSFLLLQAVLDNGEVLLDGIHHTVYLPRSGIKRQPLFLKRPDPVIMVTDSDLISRVSCPQSDEDSRYGQHMAKVDRPIESGLGYAHLGQCHSRVHQCLLSLVTAGLFGTM